MNGRRDEPVERVRVVWGTGSGPTAIASYDAALAAANVHEYNLLTVSSIVPAGASVDAVGTAPDLGPAGNRLMAVEARTTSAGPERVAAGLGWATGEGAGIVYEASDATDEESVRAELAAGLEAGKALRDYTFDDQSFEIVSEDGGEGRYTTALVLAVYGTSEPL